MTRYEITMVSEKIRWERYRQQKIDRKKRFDDIKKIYDKVDEDKIDSKKVPNYDLDAAIHSGVLASVIAATI